MSGKLNGEGGAVARVRGPVHRSDVEAPLRYALIVRKPYLTLSHARRQSRVCFFVDLHDVVARPAVAICARFERRDARVLL